MRASGGSSCGEMSCAISASVFVWKEPVRLMTIGIISTSPPQLPWSIIAWRRGAYFVCISEMVSCSRVSVEYLHSISCMTLCPLWFPRDGVLGCSLRPGLLRQPLRRIMSGLQPLGRLSLGRNSSGMIFGLSGLAGTSVLDIGVYFGVMLKSLITLAPRSVVSIGSSVLSRYWLSILKVLLCLSVRRFWRPGQSPVMWAFEICCWQCLQIRGCPFGSLYLNLL